MHQSMYVKFAKQMLQVIDKQTCFFYKIIQTNDTTKEKMKYNLTLYIRYMYFEGPPWLYLLSYFRNAVKRWLPILRH